MAIYANRTALRAACRKDSLAKLTVDPTVTEVIGTGNGTETTFQTPFESVTTAKVYVNGLAVTTGWALSRATGTDNRDEIEFTAPPALGAVISASADAAAIHADDCDAVLASVSADIEGYLHAYLPITDAALLASLGQKTVLLSRVRLRGRRNLDVVDPVEMEYRAAVRWLEDVAKGAIVLNLNESAPEVEAEGLSGSEPPLYGPPNDPLGDW